MAAASGLAVATLFGFLGGLYWVLDLFSHFRVQIFQLCLVLLGIALWRRKHKLTVFLVVLTCLNYSVVLPFYFGKSAAPSGGTVTRVMLMNLNASNGNTKQVLAAIDLAKPDLLLLEEVTPKWIHELSRLDSVYPYRIADARDDCFGIMLLSKIPLSHTNTVEIGATGVPSILATVHLPQGEISFIGTHPVPPVSVEYARRRDRQLDALARCVQEQSRPVLLVGDLNASPWSAHFRKLLKKTDVKNSMKGFGFQPSWPVKYRFLRIPIDQLLCSSRIAVQHRGIGPDVGSDHLPVIVDFSLR